MNLILKAIMALEITAGPDNDLQKRTLKEIRTTPRIRNQYPISYLMVLEIIVIIITLEITIQDIIIEVALLTEEDIHQAMFHSNQKGLQRVMENLLDPEIIIMGINNLKLL